MSSRVFVLLITLSLLLFVEVARANAANVLLTSGVVRSGTVAVRVSAWSKELVVSIQTVGKRVYQFPARKVIKVTAETEVLMREQARLHQEPSSDSGTQVRLEKGNEVTIIGARGDWVRVRAWGKHEGWVEERRLCKRVVFSKRGR